MRPVLSMSKPVAQSTSPWCRPARILIACAIGCFLFTACSFQHVDEDGVRHIWGINHVQVKQVRNGNSDVAAQQITTVGIAVFSMPEQTGFSLGFTRNFGLQVNRDSEAGEISYDPENPIDFSYKDMQKIREAYN